jgi:hypothetical protein
LGGEGMKKVLSVSLGSSTRNHRVEAEILGEKFSIERLGTDGDKKKAIEIIKEHDGKVDAFGMGGIDLYLTIKNKKYMLRSALPIQRAAIKTPMVDGTGLKNTLERMVIDYLDKEKIIDFKSKSVLITSAIDRFGLAESLKKTGAKGIYGDVFYALGIPYFPHSLTSLKRIASILLPVVRHLPFEMLYPTGKKQDEENKRNKNLEKIYQSVDIIAGDFLYIQQFMPERLDNKIIITNTITQDNVDRLKEKGVSLLITTTPEFNGRSFGTNVMEGVLISLAGKHYMDLTQEDYIDLLNKINFSPRIIYLNDEYKSLEEVQK